MKKLLLGSILLLAVSAPMVKAGHGGDAFGGAFAGSMVGGVVGSAMTQPRKETVVVKESSDSTSYWKEKCDDLQDRNRDLKEENKALRRQLEALQGKK